MFIEHHELFGHKKKLEPLKYSTKKRVTQIITVLSEFYHIKTGT